MDKSKGEFNLVMVLIKILLILVCIIVQILFAVFLYSATNKLINYAGFLFEIIQIFSVIYIISRSNDNSYKIIWIIVLMFLPVTGLILYLLWGNNITGGNKAKRLALEAQKSSKVLKKNDIDEYNISDHNRVNEFKYLMNCNNIPLYKNCRCEYYELGEYYFESLKKDLMEASNFILFEHFIISDSKMWDEIYEIFRVKALEGVDIYVLYDSLGSLFCKPSRFVKNLMDIGVNVVSFNPVTPILSSYLNYRDHRKIIVIDTITYTGGINIGDEYINLSSRFGHWKDSGVRIMGDATKSFIVMFIRLWNISSKKKLNYKRFLNIQFGSYRDKGYVMPYFDDYSIKNNPAKNTYINIIMHASKYLYIMTPYLILDDTMVNALIISASSGVDVRIMVPFIPDKKFVNACTKSFYDILLENGVKIYEYKPGFVHSKVIVSDDSVATVGTINFDFRSFYLHYECGTLMYNTQCVNKIRDDFLSNINNCILIKLNVWKKRSICRKIYESILRLISPML